MGAPWLPISCCLGVSRGKGAGGGRTACARQPSGAPRCAQARVPPSPGSPWALAVAVGCALSCRAGTVKRRRRRWRRRRKRASGPHGSLPPLRPLRLVRPRAERAHQGGPGPSSSPGERPAWTVLHHCGAMPSAPPQWDPSSQPSWWRRAWPSRPGGPAPAPRTTLSSSPYLPQPARSHEIRGGGGGAARSGVGLRTTGPLQLEGPHPGCRAIALWPYCKAGQLSWGGHPLPLGTPHSGGRRLEVCCCWGSTEDDCGWRSECPLLPWLGKEHPWCGEGLIGAFTQPWTRWAGQSVRVAKELRHSLWKGNDTGVTFPPTLIGHCYLPHL